MKIQKVIIITIVTLAIFVIFCHPISNAKNPPLSTAVLANMKITEITIEITGNIINIDGILSNMNPGDVLGLNVILYPMDESGIIGAEDQAARLINPNTGNDASAVKAGDVLQFKGSVPGRLGIYLIDKTTNRRKNDFLKTARIGIEFGSRSYLGTRKMHHVFVVPTKEIILNVQQQLSNLGYNPGAIDGIWGNATKIALKNFQQAKNLPITGSIDEQTLEILYQ